MKLIKVTVPEDFYEEMQEYCVNSGYIPLQSLIKMSVKRYMNTYKKGESAPRRSSSD